MGTGLGLALTKHLVERHGGRISATSEGEGKRSTVTVVLPFGADHPPQEAPDEAAGRAAAAAGPAVLAG